MDLSYHNTAPGDLGWAQAAFDAIQGIKAGTFDLSNAYQQFSFLVLQQLIPTALSSDLGPCA